MVRGNRRDCSMRFRWIWVVVAVVVSRVVSGHANANYGDALSKCLLFLEAQRSGRLPSTQRVSWRDHSGLTDGLLQGVDLVGGYYDAGDHVKFGLPMAFTVTMLSWSVVEYGEQLAAAGQLGHTLEAIKWGTDYFLKAHSHPHLQLLWGEVGDGNTDHYCWQRPEDMTTPRQAYKIDAANPGSDLAGETAAAMASASIVFRASNPSYSKLLLHHAKQLFEFGDKYRGKYDQSIGVVKNYYTSVSGYGDELLWGASWMYQATGNEDYLKYIVDNAESLGGTGWAITEFSWDVKYAGLQVLAAKVLMQGQGTQYSSTLEKYKSKAEFFLCACLQRNDPDSNVHLTPGGLLYIRQWNNMQYVSSASFLLTVYSDYLAAAKASLNCPKAQMDPSRLLDFATSQVNYILGKNPRATSYLVGYGTKYPEKVHHRGASIVAYKEKPSFVGCKQGYDSWYSSDSPNPNVLVGALVGGPDKHDNFEDDRRNFMQTEPCTYNVAPLIGVLAKLNGFPASKSAWIPLHPSGALRMATAAAERPVKFSHEIGKSWRRGGRTYSRHKVTVTNVSNKPITHLNIALSADDTCTENGPHMLPVWGLSRGSGAYTLPPWLKVLFPGHGFHFVYVQEGDPPIMPLNICLLSHK